MYKILDGGIEIKQILRMNESGPSLLELFHKNQYFYSANISLAVVLKLEIISAST